MNFAWSVLIAILLRDSHTTSDTAPEDQLLQQKYIRRPKALYMTEFSIKECAEV
jgi:hypothetical protein